MDGLNLDTVECNPDKSIERTNESCHQDLLIVEDSSIANLDNLGEEYFLSRNVYLAKSKQGDLFCENSCNKVPSQLPGSFQTDNVCIDAFTPVEEMVTNAIPLHDNNIVNGDCFTLTEIVPGHDSAHIVEDFVSDKMGLLSSDFQAKNAICYKSSESAPDIDDDNDSAKFPIQANMGPDCKCLSGDISDIDRSSHENEQVAIDNKDKLAFEDQNGFGEMLLNTPCNFSDIYSNDTEHGNPIESLQIPFFDHIDYESDHIAEEEFPIDNLNSISQIPNFELLQLEAHETVNCSGYEDLNVIELLKEVKYDLTRRFRNDESDDLGVTALFDEPQTSVNNSCTGVKSKSARKRKKQLLKLKKPPVASPASENVKRKFAQSFQELQSARLEFHDYNIDSKYTCPVCLEMYHMPSICNPCSHVFCDPCLRRMTSQGYEGIPCPLCRTVISSCQLDNGE
ncbi:uncharacterized protein LOC132718164 [Ruditapes philippinarum]|uniref:uncharacterized protein LOC132718164 n=1 Tax=Ruditapes philippinarum TaxID=129788 RepID=UPI00295B7BFF|nr:uncharacterized protein LOC132718164 [Ruditapes philippinarum]